MRRSFPKIYFNVIIFLNQAATIFLLELLNENFCQIIRTTIQQRAERNSPKV